MPALIEVPFGIVKPQSFYTVHGVRLPNDTYSDVQVSERRLDDGKSRTQRGWQDYRNETGWGPGSGPLITAVLTALYDNRSTEGVEELKNLFHDDFRTHWMMTATGITYRAGASDLVTHDSGTPGQTSLEARLVGPDGKLNEGMSGEIQTLLGSSDISKVSAVYEWVSGKESYLWRLNEQPKLSEERALVLGLDFDYGFGINAYDFGIGNYWPARGVRIAPQNSTGSKG